MNQKTQSLVKRIEKSTASNFTSTSDTVYHMEIDLCIPGNIIYTDENSLQTSDGSVSHTIPVSTSKGLYSITGFTQITDKRLLVVDNSHHCLMQIDRTTRRTSVFSGHCKSRGYSDGRPGKFSWPWSVIRDRNDERQLLVTDSLNRAVRTVDIKTGKVGTFFRTKSDSLFFVRGLTQDNIGDVYVTARHAIYRITYREKTISLISGSSGKDKDGYKDSSLLNSLFYWPHDLVIIGHQAILVADSNNNKIRLVDMNTDKVSTLDLCSGCLSSPRSLLITNNSLYVEQARVISQFGYLKQTTTPTTTTTTRTPRSTTPTATTPKTTRPTTNNPITTPPTNTLTTNTPKTTTLTTNTPTTTTPTTTTPKPARSTTTIPTTTLTTNNPKTTPPTTNTPTTTRPTSTTRAPCHDRNITVYVTSDEERALVEITAEVQTELSAGSHVIHTNGCTVNIEVIYNATSSQTIPTPAVCVDKNLTYFVSSSEEERVKVQISPDISQELPVGSFVSNVSGCAVYVQVINNGTDDSDIACPDIVRDIISPVTGVADVDLTIEGITHRVKLPVGSYQYVILGGDNPCNFTVEIKDNLLVRRLDMVARYDIKCSLLSDNAAISTVTTLANGNVNQIREICQQDCIPQAGSQAKLSCESDTLTVTWSTDVTFDGTVTEVPHDLKQSLTDRLAEQSRYPILNLVVITNMPPLVYPTKTETGAYAELVLTSSCLQDKMYNQKTDSCI